MYFLLELESSWKRDFVLELPPPHFVRDSCIVIFLVVIQWMHSAYFHWMFCFCYFLSWVYRQAVVHEDEEKNIMADQKEFAPDKKTKKTSPQK